MSHLDDLLSLSPAMLHARLTAGYPIDPRELDDTEYEGISLGMPEFVDQIAWKTFKKVFRRDINSRVLRGWNVAVKQTGLEGPFEDKVRRGKRVTYGHYEVWSAEDYALPGNYTFGLLIDYSKGGNRLFDPLNAVKDPLVALDEGSSEWLLGSSYADVGPLQLRTPAYFLLRRGKSLTYDVSPPRRG